MSHGLVVRNVPASRTLVAAFLIGAASASAHAQGGASSAVTASADSAFQANDWATAAKRYEAITARDSASGYAWFRLGASRHGLADYRGAVQALDRAARLGFQPLNVRLRLARAYARLGERDRALALLDTAARRGLSPQQLQSEHDLDALRADARFAAIVATAESTRYPCRAMPEAKQFDFPTRFRQELVNILSPGSVVIVTPQPLQAGSPGGALTVIETDGGTR